MVMVDIKKELLCAFCRTPETSSDEEKNRMLEKLVRVPGHAVSYDTLMNATMQSLVTNNTINTHMRNIRKKFETIDPDFKCIKSEYGFGYRWSTQ